MTTAPQNSESTETADAVGIRSSDLFVRMLFVYELKGVVRCFYADEIRPMESAMLEIGWKHTSTIDPARWIEAMANGNTAEAVLELRAISPKKDKASGGSVA